MVTVFDENGKAVGRVEYTSNLDYWDGRNYTCGSTGRHKGLTKLKDGRFVLVHGTQWVNERDYAEIISDEQALQEILIARAYKLLDKYFPDYKDLEEEAADPDEKAQ